MLLPYGRDQNVLEEDDHGRLWSNYYDRNGVIIYREVLSVSRLKLSSGILYFSLAHPLSVRTVYVSNAVTHLIFFVQSYAGRLNWDYVAFVATGAKVLCLKSEA